MRAAALKSQVIMKDIELSVAKKNFGKNNPQMTLLQNELQGLEEKYSEFFTKNLKDQLFPSFESVPGIIMQLKKLERKSDYYSKVLEFLGPQYEKAKIDETKDIPTIQILDKAIRPEKKDKPHRARIVILVFIISITVTAICTVLFEGIKERNRSI